MKFRRNRNPAVEEETKFEERNLELEPGGREPARGRWSTTFLIVGSALLGATALAFWNRRTIANMRAQIQAREAIAGPAAPSNEEIF